MTAIITLCFSSLQLIVDVMNSLYCYYDGKHMCSIYKSEQVNSCCERYTDIWEHVNHDEWMICEYNVDVINEAI